MNVQISLFLVSAIFAHKPVPFYFHSNLPFVFVQTMPHLHRGCILRHRIHQQGEHKPAQPPFGVENGMCASCRTHAKHVQMGSCLYF